MRPTGFHHLAIRVQDLARAERFYAGVLGLTVVRRWPWPAAEHGQQAEPGRSGERALWLSLAPPDSVPPPAAGAPGLAGGLPGTLPDALLSAGFLALEACDGEAPGRPFRDSAPGLHLVALRITAPERAAWEELFAARGVPVVHRSRWTLYVQDPEGNRVGLSHHPDDR